MELQQEKIIQSQDNQQSKFRNVQSTLIWRASHLEPQIPTPNIQQNETEQIIENYECSDCGAKFRDKEKVCEHFLKVHKKKIVFLDTQNLAGPSQVSQRNNWHTNCEKCDLPILNESLEFHKKQCVGP